MALEVKHATWEEKIDNLARLAHAAGIYLEVEAEDPGSAYCTYARRKLCAAYIEFCAWRYDSPSLVDEIKEHISGFAVNFGESL